MVSIHVWNILQMSSEPLTVQVHQILLQIYHYYDNTAIIESSVDLQWNRPSYTGGVPIVNYIVSIDDMNIMNTSNEMISLTLPENINENVYIHLLVVVINLCGLESEASENITIPAESIIVHMILCSCIII